MATINFNDGIFAQEALQAFTAALTPLSAFSRSFSSATAQKGNAVYVPRVEQVTPTTFAYANNSGVPYEGSDGTVNTVTITLDKHQIVTCDLTDIDVANSSAAEISHFAQQQGRALGKRVQQAIWASFTTANFGVAIVSTSIQHYGRAGIASARLAMAKRDVPIEDLSLILNEDANHVLLGDSNITQAYAYGGAEAIRNGEVSRVLGLDTYHTNLMITTESLVGVVAHPDGIAVAIRYLQPLGPGEYMSVLKLVDPTSGITMGYRRHYNPGKGKMFASFECLFGFGVGLSLGVGLLKRND
jgi:hypothetical protein